MLWRVSFFNFMADFGEWFLSYTEPKAGFQRKPFKEWGKGK